MLKGTKLDQAAWAWQAGESHRAESEFLPTRSCDLNEHMQPPLFALSRNRQEGGEGGEEGALPQLEAEAGRSGVGSGGQSPESESSITYSFLRSAQP